MIAGRPVRANQFADYFKDRCVQTPPASRFVRLSLTLDFSINSRVAVPLNPAIDKRTVFCALIRRLSIATDGKFRRDVHRVRATRPKMFQRFSREKIRSSRAKNVTWRDLSHFRVRTALTSLPRRARRRLTWICKVNNAFQSSRVVHGGNTSSNFVARDTIDRRIIFNEE